MISTSPVPTQEAITKFKLQFFGEGNDLKWSETPSTVLSRKAQKALRPWLEDLDEAPLRPVCLPRVRKGQTTWYVISWTQIQHLEMTELLLASVGPSYSSFDGRTANLDMEDPVEASIQNFSQGFVCKIPVCKAKQRGEVRIALETLRSQLRSRPSRTQHANTPTDQLIRNLEIALQFGQHIIARRLIDALRTGGRLDARNLLFLEIRWLEVQERWGDIVGLAEFPSLTQIQRPSKVTQAALRALYHVHLKTFEQGGEVSEALGVFNKKILAPHPRLFNTPGQARSPEALCCFLMLAVTTTPPRNDLRARVLEALQDIEGASSPLTEALAKLNAEADSLKPESTPVAVQTPLAVAREMMDRRDFSGALTHLRNADPEPRVVESMIFCAFALDTLEASEQIKAVMGGLDESVRKDVLALRLTRDAWTAINTIFEGPQHQVCGWLEWSERFAEKPSWSDAVDLVRRGQGEWSLKTFEKDSSVEKFNNDLQELVYGNGQSRLKRCLPYLLDVFRPDDSEVRFKPIYKTMLDLVTLENNPGKIDLITFNEVLSSLLGIGFAGDELAGALEDLQTIWATAGSFNTLEQGMNLFETLLTNACDRSHISRFVAQLLQTFRPMVHRVDRIQRTMLEQLCKEVEKHEDYLHAIASAPPGLDDSSVVTVDQINYDAALNGKKLVCYTLTPGVAERVKSLVEKTFQGASVFCSHAKAGSTQLGERVRSADVILMSTRSAKHAATIFIQQHVKQKSALIKIHAKGSSSMLAALNNHLQKQLLAT